MTPGGGKMYGHGMPVDESIFLDYFTPAGARCSTCGYSVDLWERVQEALTGFTLFSKGTAAAPTHKPLMRTSNALGLCGTALRVPLKPDEATQVDLGDYDIPATAKILSINVTPEGSGSLFPAQMIQQRVLGEALPRTMALLPWIPPGRSGEAITVGIWVLWVGESFVAPSFIHVVDALIHYTHNEFEKSVRSGQLAVEEPFKDLIQRAFDSKGVLPRTVERLLARRPHYEIVDSVLPSLAEDLGIPPMPLHLAKGLKKLAELRNRSSHRASAAVTETEARDGLISALFGLYYALYFDGRLKVI